jgi:hypothetical protein
MNLFRIADRPIAWADVQDFCAQREVEGATLDYKKDIPKELERVISAMANTLGGVIIIGVAEDNESRPVVPAEGIAMAKGLVERITSICVDNIYPPIVPDTQLCVNDAGDKAFLVIRVDQSREAPHAIGSNTRVYVRTGSLSDPDVLATLDRIKWLSERREGAERFREWLQRHSRWGGNRYSCQSRGACRQGVVDASCVSCISKSGAARAVARNGTDPEQDSGS